MSDTNGDFTESAGLSGTGAGAQPAGCPSSVLSLTRKWARVVSGPTAQPSNDLSSE